MVNLTVIKNDEYKKLTEKGTLTIVYGYQECPFGKCLIGLVGEEICHLAFVEKENSGVEELKRLWPGASFRKDEKKTVSTAKEIFSGDKDFLRVKCRGTDFQEAVWRQLLKIPEGKTWSYEELAENVGKPKGLRACGNACGSNPVGYLIPCHRVIKKSGATHKYRGGCEIKKRILAAEKKKDVCG